VDITVEAPANYDGYDAGFTAELDMVA